jgi:phosphofructokinase-like protein
VTEIHTIGVANGGGDCAGLNAVIRAVVKTATLRYGWRVVGITNGFDGLIWSERSVEMTLDSVRGLLPLGGTILGTTNRGNPFAYSVEENGSKVTKDFSALCLQNAEKLGLDALVVIGGEGTLGITRDFGHLGMKAVGIPKTIDHDVSATETTLGFDTALHIATEAIDRLHTTAESHGRVMIIEVMGRNTGWIALHSGIAGGADLILIPEIPFYIEHVCQKIRERDSAGRHFTLIVVAEGAKLPPIDANGRPLLQALPGQISHRLGEIIGEMLNREIRITVLGHIQRGGSPTPFDRVLATRFGSAAVDMIECRQFGRMVTLCGGKIDSVSLEAIQNYRTVDPSCDHVRAARGVGISFGDGL